MKSAHKNVRRLLPLPLVACIGFAGFFIGCRVPPSLAQTPGATAWSATQQVLSQDISSATANAVYSGAQALSSRAQAKSSKKSVTAQQPAATATALTAPAPESTHPPVDQVMPSQAQANAQQGYDARRTLFVELAQKKLRLEAPETMCFLDRTSPMQESIYQLLAALAERKHDQVLLGVFMDCDNILSPADWHDGMPDAGFVTWLNPLVGEKTHLSRPDYLDMREANFLEYADGRRLGLHPDKAVHRNKYNVSVAVADDIPAQDGTRHKSTTVLATTTVRRVPVEFTMHYAGDIYAGDPAPEFDQAYSQMDKLMVQQIMLNK